MESVKFKDQLEKTLATGVCQDRVRKKACFGIQITGRGIRIIHLHQHLYVDWQLWDTTLSTTGPPSSSRKPTQSSLTQYSNIPREIKVFCECVCLPDGGIDMRTP